MSEMSSKTRRDFVSISKLVFPQNVYFNPMDYYEMFNTTRDNPLGVGTYKAYLGKSINSGFFSELTRSRNHQSDPFLYFLTTSNKEPSKPSKSRLSDKFLEKFIEVMQTVIIPNRWYTCSGLRNKYNRHVWRFKVGKNLKTSTVKEYLYLVLKSDAWPGLVREIERGNAYRYKWVVTPEEKPLVKATKEEKQLKRQVNFREHQARLREKRLQLKEHQSKNYGITSEPSDKLFKLEPIECKSCGGRSPGEACWCMHCGSRLLKIVFQECVLTLPGKPGMSKYTPKIEAFIKDHIVENLLIQYSEEDLIYIVSVKG